jgi:hypothetical protein
MRLILMRKIQLPVPPLALPQPPPGAAIAETGRQSRLSHPLIQVIMMPIRRMTSDAISGCGDRLQNFQLLSRSAASSPNIEQNKSFDSRNYYPAARRPQGKGDSRRRPSIASSFKRMILTRKVLLPFTS